MADVFRYFIYLASIIKQAKDAAQLPAPLLDHAVRAYNKRWDEMVVPIVCLALFMHPGYRILSTMKGEFDLLSKTVLSSTLTLVNPTIIRIL
jgi:hypothetical protein